MPNSLCMPYVEVSGEGTKPRGFVVLLGLLRYFYHSLT
jgi:hypothetical protein